MGSKQADKLTLIVTIILLLIVSVVFRAPVTSMEDIQDTIFNAYQLSLLDTIPVSTLAIPHFLQKYCLQGLTAGSHSFFPLRILAARNTPTGSAAIWVITPAKLPSGHGEFVRNGLTFSFWNRERCIQILADSTGRPSWSHSLLSIITSR